MVTISRFRLTVAAIALFVLSVPVFTAAQDDGVDENVDGPDQKKWLIWESVQRFTGQATIHESSWTDRQSGPDKEKVSGHATASISFELVREPPLYSEGTSRWVPVKVTVAGDSLLSQLYSSPTHRLSAESESSFAQSLTDSPYPVLSLSHETGEFEFLSPGQLDTPVTEYVNRSEWRYMGETVNNSYTVMRDYIASSNFYGRANEDIGPLSATVEQVFVEEDGKAGHREFGRVVLAPEYDDYDIEVKIDGYNRWRPLGSIAAPTSPGSSVIAHATLIPKTPGQSKLPNVQYFSFALLDTSREPGVCMNYPLHAKDNFPDMRLAASGAGTPELGDEDQTLKVSGPARDKEGRPFASARIESYDFGGRAELMVTARLEDGREITGHLQGSQSADKLIPLPKRAPSRWIADAWHDEHGTHKLSDFDDSENEPVHDGHPGDGFTYYEEYRGFAENGEWLYTSPKQRDMFIYQDSGTDRGLSIGDKFQAGIDLFGELTGITMHEKLRDEEYDWKVRVMNANRREGPHLVKQHGVSMTMDTYHRDAETLFAEGTTKGRLRKTLYVNVSLVGQDMDLTDMVVPSDRQRGRDRAVAHELLHTVGVEHHGEGAGGKLFYVRAAGHPDNPTSRTAFVSHSTGKVVRLLHETTRQDIIETIRSVEERDQLAEFVRSNKQEFVTHWGGVETVAAQQEFFDRVERDELYAERYIEGRYGDQHSGDDQCVMRYSYAQIYQAIGNESLFYLVPPGSEPAGLQLCRSPEGTGVNLLGREPQSRYGPSGQGLGDCFHKICVSDRYH